MGSRCKVGLKLIPKLRRLVFHSPVALLVLGEKYLSFERLPSSSALTPTITR